MPSPGMAAAPVVQQPTSTYRPPTPIAQTGPSAHELAMGREAAGMGEGGAGTGETTSTEAFAGLLSLLLLFATAALGAAVVTEALTPTGESMLGSADGATGGGSGGSGGAGGSAGMPGPVIYQPPTPTPPVAPAAVGPSATPSAGAGM